MIVPTPEEHDWFAETLRRERTSLVRLCASVTGDYTAAEDLAQETLVEAWRQRQKVYDPSGIRPWLAAIARNVCRRWWQARATTVAIHPGAEVTGVAPNPPDELDLELEIERADLARLLEQALRLLPDESRTALIARLIDDLPHAQIAEHLGLSEGAVKMRLKRGKLALRHILVTKFPDEAAAYGIGITASGPQTANIWCPLCGNAKMEATLDRERGDFTLQCPICFPSLGITTTRVEREPRIFAGVQGYKRILNRVIRAVVPSFRDALMSATVPCFWCGSPAIAVHQLPSQCLLRERETRGLQIFCPSCGEVAYLSLGGLITATPAVQQFWRAHSRIRSLPEYEIEVDGRAALVSRLEGVTRDVQLDIVVDAERFTILSTHLH